MIEFHLVKSNKPDVFEQSINEKIGEGWDLRGPMMTSSQGWVYMQPMTRKIKKAKKKEKKDAVA